jgi:hypothetical protein
MNISLSKTILLELKKSHELPVSWQLLGEAG